ncbi:MAG: acyl--CoA ligase [Pseudonocardia sp.]|nr:acyl--CoA ligase [Pseudonocardia sp.]
MVAVPDLIDFPATLPSLWARCLERHSGQDLAITEDGRHVTYADADAAARRLSAELLAAGAGKGTRIGILLPQAPEWIISYLAIGRIGGVAVTISTFSKPYELAKILAHSDAAILVTTSHILGRDVGEALEEALPALAGAGSGPLRLVGAPFLRTVLMLDAPADGANTPGWARTPEPGTEGPVSAQLLDAVEASVHPADPLLIVYTSGTTSEPKGIVHTHGALVRHGENLRRMGVALEGDRIYAGMPFFWVGGVSYTLGPTLHVGATLLLQERFDPAGALRFMERERATHLTGWSTLVLGMINHPDLGTTDLSTLRQPLGSRTRPRSGLGMTETAASYIYFPPGDEPLPADPRASGEVMEGFEVRIHDERGRPVPTGQEGVIAVRGYSVTVGQVRRERHEVFDEDGWFSTGDRGWIDGSGVVWFTGRDTEMIKTKGSNVAPPEVESVLMAHPSVTMATVVGLPHPELGQEVAAAVAVRDAANGAPSPDELRDWVRTRLASYKSPRTLLVVGEAEVPTLASGKIDRRRLAQWVADHRTR